MIADLYPDVRKWSQSWGSCKKVKVWRSMQTPSHVSVMLGRCHLNSWLTFRFADFSGSRCFFFNVVSSISMIFCFEGCWNRNNWNLPSPGTCRRDWAGGTNPRSERGRKQTVGSSDSFRSIPKFEPVDIWLYKLFIYIYTANSVCCRFLELIKCAVGFYNHEERTHDPTRYDLRSPVSIWNRAGFCPFFFGDGFSSYVGSSSWGTWLDLAIQMAVSFNSGGYPQIHGIFVWDVPWAIQLLGLSILGNPQP